MLLGDNAEADTVSTAAVAAFAAVLVAVAVPVAPESDALALVVRAPIELLTALAVPIPPVMFIGPARESATATAVD
jgi:hypothetical protein